MAPDPVFSGFSVEHVTSGPFKKGPRCSPGGQVSTNSVLADKGPPVFENGHAFKGSGTPNMSKWRLSGYIIIIEFDWGNAQSPLGAPWCPLGGPSHV